MLLSNSFACAPWRIANPPQVANLPHKKERRNLLEAVRLKGEGFKPGVETKPCHPRACALPSSATATFLRRTAATTPAPWGGRWGSPPPAAGSLRTTSADKSARY